MEVLDPTQPKVLLPHSGTFSANPVTMTAGITAMRLFDEKAVDYVNALGDLARKEISHAIEKVGIKACVTGAGSMFRIHLKPQAPNNYRQSYANEDEAKGMVDRVVSDFGRIDILINNAGGIAGKPADSFASSVSFQDLTATLDRNLMGTIFCSQAAAGHMRAKGWGRIVNTSS